MTVANQFEDLTSELKELKTRMVERGKEVFKDEAAKIFENDSALESFSWTQYTPYFNDGEPCEFSVHDYLTITFSDDIQVEDWSASEWSRNYYKDKYSVEALDTADAAHELVTSIPEEVMEDLFGDHVKVTVYRDKIEVDEYDHD